MYHGAQTSIGNATNSNTTTTGGRATVCCLASLLVQSYLEQIPYLESTSAPDCSKHRARATFPLRAISCRASFRQFFPTPHSTKTFTASSWPCLAAKIKGVIPRESIRSIMADIASSAEMTCACPAIDDKCKGVRSKPNVDPAATFPGSVAHALESQ